MSVSSVTVKQLAHRCSSGLVLQQLRTICTTQCRPRRVFWTTRPMPRGTERRILNAVTVPVYPADPRPPEEQCLDVVREKEEARKSELMDAYHAFKLKEAMEILTQNKMVAICHRLPTTTRDFQKLRNTLFTADFHLKFIRNDLAIKGTEKSRLHNLKPYFTSSTAYVVSETVEIAKLIKVLKKCPELQLMGALVEDKIMSKDELIAASKLPSLDVMRGELVTILNSSACKTRQLLTHHQSSLSQNLSQLVKQGQESTGENSDT